MQISSRFQILHEQGSSSSSSSSSCESDSPLRRFNKILQSSLARHWQYFRSAHSSLRSRGRSLSDVGLSSIAESRRDYFGVPKICRRSLQVRKVSTHDTSEPSSGGSSIAAGPDEHSDGSDADKTRRSAQYLRVPTPAFSTQSTGNFAGGAAGGCGAPRSAPATPLQIESHKPTTTKQVKHAVKPLSSSVPSVRGAGTGAGAASDASEGGAGGKAPSKSRQKKFLRHFPQVGPDERVLNYYSCALVGDILLQGHLYITKNYFAFYSNVFGYVTKLLIPTTSVLRVTKEKMARIIPNAVGVCTREERHVFGSLLSRDSTYKLMTHVWKAAGSGPLELTAPPPPQERVSEVDIDVSEYSPEDESSSAGGDCDAQHAKRRESEAILPGGGSAVIQPALLTGAASVLSAANMRSNENRVTLARCLLILVAVLLGISALFMTYRLYQIKMYPEDELASISGAEMYSELVRWRTKLHGRAASELHAFLTSNLMLLSKVRQSLETLSNVILTDMNHSGQHKMNMDIPPNDTVYS